MIFSLLWIWIKNGKLYLPHGGDNRPILLWYQVFSYFIFLATSDFFIILILHLLFDLDFFFCELERFDIVLSPFYTIFYLILCVVFLLINLNICLIMLSLFSNMIFPLFYYSDMYFFWGSSSFFGSLAFTKAERCSFASWIRVLQKKIRWMVSDCLQSSWVFS